MYLWIGCKLPEEFEREIRQTCLSINKEIGLDTAAFLLPQHISLKISFQTDRPEEVLEDVSAFLAGEKPFTVRILSPEPEGSILWMPVAENPHLERLHAWLDARLESRFGIPQHEFDRCFKFHSTLFMDPDTEKTARMCRALSQYPIGRELAVNSFLLGMSETGKPGDCRIVREIKV